MNYLRTCLLLLVMTSIGLHAGAPIEIAKDSKAQKEMKLSVEHKDSAQNQNKVTITVSFKGDKFTKVNLINDGKNSAITTEVKEGVVSLSFEIEKKDIEKGMLRIIDTGSPAMCGNQYFLYLKGYVV